MTLPEQAPETVAPVLSSVAADAVQTRNGVVAALSAYLFWGFLPILFRALDAVGSVLIVAERTLFSLVLLAGILALRRMAPTRPALAGLAAGIMAGGTGAWIYSFACDEPGMMFLALWYTLAILVVGSVGSLLGRLLLRW